MTIDSGHVLSVINLDFKYRRDSMLLQKMISSSAIYESVIKNKDNQIASLEKSVSTWIRAHDLLGIKNDEYSEIVGNYEKLKSDAEASIKKQNRQINSLKFQRALIGGAGFVAIIVAVINLAK